MQENINTAYKASRAYSTIGFASTLSHSMVIREQQEEDAAGDEDAALTEEELALSGAPWAKEGIIQRKHFWESPLKRAKDKAWLQVFVVISKGELRMFRFDGAGTVRGGGGGMGGGDWMVSYSTTWGLISWANLLGCCRPTPIAWDKSRLSMHCAQPSLPLATTNHDHIALCSPCQRAAPTFSKRVRKTWSRNGFQPATIGRRGIANCPCRVGYPTWSMGGVWLWRVEQRMQWMIERVSGAVGVCAARIVDRANSAIGVWPLLLLPAPVLSRLGVGTEYLLTSGSRRMCRWEKARSLKMLSWTISSGTRESLELNWRITILCDLP